MICLPLVVGEAINLDFKHTTLATQPGDCAVCGFSSRDAKLAY